MLNKILLGSHMSFKSPGYLFDSAKESVEQGANCMMIYLGTPQNARRTPFEVMKYQEYFDNFSMVIKPENIVVHAPYIINPASVEKHEFAKTILLQEISSMKKIGIKYIVLHPGAYTSFSKDESIKTLISVLKEILSNEKEITILLETMAGKGTEIGTSLDEISNIIHSVGSENVGVCLDTCHLWESGFDIRDTNHLIEYLKKVRLLDRVKVIHVNDSKNELGAKKDRHENIGKGKIGFEALFNIVHNDAFDDVIKILETPYVDDKPIYEKEIKMLLKK